MEAGDAIALLDVREVDERLYARVPTPPGVVDLHIPLGELTSQWETVADACKGRTLVVYCHHGVRSMVAATWLARRGVSPVANMEGGIDQWSLRVDREVRRY